MRPDRPHGSLLARFARRFRRDDGGNVIIYVSLTAALLLGIVGLALDGSRAMITHSEAQGAADAAALAGASQLDGQTGACARAKSEATQVANQQRFAQSGPANITIAAGSPVCLSSIPANDNTAIGAGYATTVDASSQYVSVTTQQLTHQNTFLNALSNQTTATIQNTAVAGFRRSLCAASPVVMICDTFTWTPGIAFDVWNNAGGSLKGWLSTCGNSAPCVQTTLASTTATFCVVDNSIQPAPGNKTQKAAAGINTRFGQGSTASEPSDTDIISYPLDNTAGTLGWNCAGYWTTNHATDGLAKPTGCTSNATTVTRYSVYQAERAAGKIPAAGVPSTSNTTTDERRLAYIAIFNCSGGTVPEAFIKAFMLQPAQGASTFTQYVEPLELATSKTDPNAVHEEVQLYR
jgi:Flp pilus assembly protein TadG